MPIAVVLLSVEGKETNRVAEALTSIEGVSEVYSVAGNFDLVAILRVNTDEGLADLVTTNIRSIPGVLTSQTLIAFRAYSARDLNSMFDMS